MELSKYGFNILQIETVAKCNMACSFCPYPLKEDKSSMLNMDLITKLIDQIDPYDPGFEYITFSQFNEPLLDNRIFDIVKYAKSKNFKVQLITNGLLLNKEKNIKGIIENDIQLKISLQVLDSTKHKDARGLNLEIESYLKTIINFLVKVAGHKTAVSVDIGSNFVGSIYKYHLRKILGLTVGDPSIPRNLKSTVGYLKKYLYLFYEIADKKYKDQLYKFINDKKLFDSDYIKQEGFKIFDNVIIKIKPFFYGRRIKDFYPINNNFACNSQILGVLADGNVVPCCLAYDDSISLGKISQSNTLEKILQNNKFLRDLRTPGAEKHLTCKKCFGEPTKRGAYIRNTLNYIK
jgi:radical SAM protein with 4Fe4S-binding SPASM domain